MVVALTTSAGGSFFQYSVSLRLKNTFCPTLALHFFPFNVVKYKWWWVMVLNLFTILKNVTRSPRRLHFFFFLEGERIYLDIWAFLHNVYVWVTGLVLLLTLCVRSSFSSPLIDCDDQNELRNEVWLGVVKNKFVSFVCSLCYQLWNITCLLYHTQQGIALHILEHYWLLIQGLFLLVLLKNELPMIFICN